MTVNKLLGFWYNDNVNQIKEITNMWACCLDGYPVRYFQFEEDAIQWCAMYDGDKDATYVYE